MQVLEKLIRIRKRNLDEIRREVVGLEGLSASIKDNAAGLEEEIRVEQRHAATAEIAVNYGAYARQAIFRRENLARSLADVEARLAAARDAAAEAFQEIKRLETLVENERERLRKEQAQRDQVELDEIALQQFTARAG